MEQIKTFKDIDYESNPEGRLLFAALAILAIEWNNTPDEIIHKLNAKADSLLPFEFANYKQTV